MMAIAKGKRPLYFENPETDKLLAMVLVLAEEVSVLRDRLDTVERLAQAKGLLSHAEIDAYQPDPQAAAEREQQRAAYIARILRIVQADVEAIAPETPVEPATARSPS
ncbi:hypothetical protein H6F90_23105 [Trichocoleus sp. FACHB-591]|nr:hypothetical protein [Trichocoleus sp. FACHB-591]